MTHNILTNGGQHRANVDELGVSVHGENVCCPAVLCVIGFCVVDFGVGGVVGPWSGPGLVGGVKEVGGGAKRGGSGAQVGGIQGLRGG